MGHQSRGLHRAQTSHLQRMQKARHGEEVLKGVLQVVQGQ